MATVVMWIAAFGPALLVTATALEAREDDPPMVGIWTLMAVAMVCLGACLVRYGIYG